MTREEFIEELKDKGYSYKLELDRIIVTEKGTVVFNSLETLPSGVVFNNEDSVWLRSLETLPPGIEFKNKGDIYLEKLISNNQTSDSPKWFSDWEGNINSKDTMRYISPITLMNVMIKRGIFL